MNSQEPKQIIKIVAIGPESTGKSTLCATLAKHFSTIWCKEYAREYLLDQATEAAIDLHKQAGGEGLPILFIDTNMYVMKVWCEFVFGNCHPFILKEIVQRSYDGYLLCKTDLPWVKDELREYPDLETRENLYYHYKDVLINQSLPWYEVKGQDPARSQSAIEWVSSLLR